MNRSGTYELSLQRWGKHGEATVLGLQLTLRLIQTHRLLGDRKITRVIIWPLIADQAVN